MTVWLYAASEALASESQTLSLAYESGFVWRSFYNRSGIPIACVKDIQPGDDLVLGYRRRGVVKLLARFRVGRPDQPIASSRAFGKIPAVWADEFRKHGYADDPTLGTRRGSGSLASRCAALSRGAELGDVQRSMEAGPNDEQVEGTFMCVQ